jgi:hypothetical protein
MNGSTVSWESPRMQGYRLCRLLQNGGEILILSISAALYCIIFEFPESIDEIKKHMYMKEGNVPCTRTVPVLTVMMTYTWSVDLSDTFRHSQIHLYRALYS